MTRMVERKWLTAMNCSIGRSRTDISEGLEAARRAGFERVELWWPFDVPDPSEEQMDEVVAVLGDLRLVALNMWAGDMEAGDRGVLHRQDMPGTHLTALEYFHARTGVSRFNLLLGAGGRRASDQQVERFAKVSQAISQRFGGIAMVEPLSEVEDYPICSLEDAQDLLKRAGSGGLLLDVYHLATNYGADYVEQRLAEVQPVHVQVADVPGRGEPGSGKLPLERWVKTLRSRGFKEEVVGEWL